MKNSSNGQSKSLDEKLIDLDNTLKDYVRESTKEMFKLLEKHEKLEEKLTQEQMKITNLLISHQEKFRPNRLNNALIVLFIVMLAVTFTFVSAGILAYKQFKSFYIEQTLSFKEAMSQKEENLSAMSKEFEDYFMKSREVINKLQEEIKSLKEK